MTENEKEYKISNLAKTALYGSIVLFLICAQIHVIVQFYLNRVDKYYISLPSNISYILIIILFYILFFLSLFKKSPKLFFCSNFLFIASFILWIVTGYLVLTDFRFQFFINPFSDLIILTIVISKVDINSIILEAMPVTAYYISAQRPFSSLVRPVYRTACIGISLLPLPILSLLPGR